METKRKGLNEIVETMEHLSYNDLGQLTGGFEEINPIGGLVVGNSNNSDCSGNGKCKNNGTCRDNGTCRNNGHCVQKSSSETDEISQYVDEHDINKP